jgi:long-subunit fatty acid transport protein
MEYKTVTPMKWGAGLAYTFGNYGLVSVDYEGTDYSTLKMYGYEDGYYVKWEDADKEAREKFKMATNIRAGAEYRINQYALRAGYAYYGSPVKNENSFARHTISAGAGYQWNGGFIDAVYSFSPGNKESLLLYADNNILKSTNFAGKFVITLGFRF